MKKWMLKNRVYFIGAILGGSAGFFYWKYVGCLTGTCAITSHPVRSALYGALMGSLLAGIFSKPSKKQVQHD